jgi:hypothetical protein
VGRVTAAADGDRLQLDLLGVEMLEQPAALAEDDRDDVELDLVEKAGLQAL